jgi:hypothetical protein
MSLLLLLRCSIFSSVVVDLAAAEAGTGAYDIDDVEL